MDLDGDGKRNGFIDLDQPDNENAFSSIRVPIGVIKNGEGPTVFLTAGNHGDEYEGQVVLHRLMAMLEPGDVSGRLIMMPALNTPAMLDRARVSPLDQGNMNRSFPGAIDQGPTKAIAGFVNEHLISRADLILDFHSGGTATQYVDCAFLCWGDNDDLNAANLALAESFGAPFTMVCPIGGPYSGDLDTAAYNQGTRFLSCELGGMGTFTASSFENGWQGCLGILAGAGLISEAVQQRLGGKKCDGETCFLDLAAGTDHITSACHGLAETHLTLGSTVEEDVPAVTIHNVHVFGAAPERHVTPRAGIVAVRRRNPLVRPGDHLLMICDTLERSALDRPSR
ncbi:MAG: succinylglutamate desuccinylase/aspartoacylase family protein [Alphaproteobacteria bacterium]|nr:N-alpha-acetyl diaminobutyric acid deacetylase DoeB [Rhodospirillaceae bacterium]MBT6510989.1 N-alpha-acetyl diaminobutyric acid deacetylase DoeB [Rhodospirillaceae bacterium]MBT7611764.1 N-alpha-acetyl diaminobutyric acid deacetylase DoeB [Rhodospirillaceae bacterium]MDG2480445.1 succinylglutamate desuccinylase/aspartoacylase family protein [Alphaproteobacteria bacterium]